MFEYLQSFSKIFAHIWSASSKVLVKTGFTQWRAVWPKCYGNMSVRKFTSGLLFLLMEKKEIMFVLKYSFLILFCINCNAAVALLFNFFIEKSVQAYGKKNQVLKTSAIIFVSLVGIQWPQIFLFTNMLTRKEKSKTFSSCSKLKIRALSDKLTLLRTWKIQFQSVYAYVPSTANTCK